MPEQCGNPLLRDWVKDWMDKAQTLQSKAYFTYKKAYDSLCKCPVTFSHPSEAICLSGIGEGMVKRLEENMRKYCNENGLPMPSRPAKSKGKRRREGSDEIDNSESGNEGSNRVKSRKIKPYIPGFRTGGYAILLALLEMRKDNQLNGTREQICDLAQSHCDASFTMPDAGKSYTAWNSMKTLCDKGYVWKNGKPAKYQLTDTGVELAEKLKQVNNSRTEASLPSSLPTSSGAAFAAAAALYDDNSTNSNVDMSLYVLHPSNNRSDSLITGPGSAQRTISSNSSILNDTYIPTPDDQNRSISYPCKRKYEKKKTKKTTTSDLLDRLLEERESIEENDSNRVDMSLYVLDPSQHQTISTDRHTTLSNDTSTASPCGAFTIPQKHVSSSLGTSFSITNESASSFTKRDINDLDNYEIDNLSTNNKSFLTRDQAPKTKSSASTSKPIYSIDEYEVDSAPSSFPLYKSGSTKEDNIIDLLSSPELSPLLQPTESATLSETNSSFIFEDGLDSDKNFFPLSQSRAKQIAHEMFHFTYLDATNEPVRHVTQAAVYVDEVDHSLAYLVKFYTSQSRHPKVQHVIQQRVEGQFTTGYLREGATEPVCSGLPASPVIPLHREEEDDFWPKSTEGPFLFDSQSSVRSDNTQSQQRLERDLASQTFFPLSQSNQPCSAITNYADLVATEACTAIQPDEYDFFLVLDSREIQMKSNRDYFQERLTAKGIQVITRSMELGDVIWIAKKKGSNNQSDELVLDCIIERKRLDDLVSSIKDGRFTEQKTRLKRSGIERVIYVVEEYNREEAERFGMQAIQTALSTIQIVDGIFLKRTQNIDETIDYLVSTTQLIKQIYSRTTLYSIPGHIVTRQNYLDLKDVYREKQASEEGKVAYLVNYPLFSQLNTKNGSTSLHEVYLRMLMTIRGINAERALSLMKIYPTPHSLLLAFKGKTLDEAKKLAKDATQGQISRRRWGKEASDKLYQVWGAPEYPNIENNENNDMS